MRVSYPPGPRRNALVIAPHPDDDAIGCGGTLRRLAAAGTRVEVMYITDGSASHRNSKRFPPASLRRIREAEARAALAALGIRTRPHFLRAPDSGLSELDAEGRDRLVRAIARRVDGLRPRVVFAPWRRDPHPDHVVTAELVATALAASRERPRLYAYGVWLPVRGGAQDAPQSGEAVAFDVRLRPDDLRRKRAAIMAHRSQTGTLIDDDPAGFVIDEPLLVQWLTPVERFYCPGRRQTGTLRQ